MTVGEQQLRALKGKLQRLVAEASSTRLEPRPAGELPPALLDIARQLNALAAAALEISARHGEQERIRAEAEQVCQRYAFLAEASAVLSSSLDYDTTLSAVAELAVRQMADWCLVGIVQPDGSLKRLALAHKDPVKVEWARRLARKYPTDPNAGWGSSLVFRTGKSEILREIPDELLVTWARDAEHLEMLRTAGFTSSMCVPLMVRGRVLGTITFASTQGERRYGAEDLALAEDLARRAAVAVDHAILHDNMQKDRAMLEEALAALRENEVRLRMALDAGRMGIWDWDVQTRHLNAPDNLVTMYGAAQEFDGKFESFLAMVHPEDRPEFQASFERVLEQKSRFEHEFRMVYPDGSVRWVAGMGKVYCDQNDRPVRIIGLGMDVTERRSLEEKLRSSQKLESIGLLAGGIAHDFNNLLTGIMGNAGLALQILPKPSPAAPLMQNVVHASERAADLTQQLLAYAGKGRFVVAPLDLSAMVRQIANLVQSTISKMVHLEMELDGSLPMMEADASQIQQVVMNLVINAAEAIGERAGTVRVKTGLQAAGEPEDGEELKPGNYVFLEVRDTGSGMDRDTLGRIFDPFFTTKFTGRGLGLAAVSGIVRSHRGAIRVSSEPEKGSTFQVLFPASSTYAAAGPPAGVEEDLHGSGLILVIDDEESVRATAGMALSRYGYDVELAENGGRALEVFRSRPAEFAMVLLDLTMPVMGGATVLRLLKEVRPDIPVIVSSGYSEVDANRRFPPGTLAGFLQKPYTGATLAQKVKAALCSPVPLPARESSVQQSSVPN